MNIETLGHGPDLVLVHGWAMHGGIFAPLTPLLTGNFRVHLVDLPGHGYSMDDDDTDSARWAERIIEAVPPAIWVGWSLGGLVVLQAALASIGRIFGIVEIAASPRFVTAPDWPHAVDTDMLVQFDAGLRQDYRQTIEHFLALEAMGSAHAQNELRELKALVFERGEPAALALEQGLRMLATTDLRAQLKNLAVPSLWIAGRNDRLVPSAAMRWASEQCVQGRFMEIASGHAPFLGHAAKFAEAIIAFANALVRA